MSIVSVWSATFPSISGRDRTDAAAKFVQEDRPEERLPVGDLEGGRLFAREKTALKLGVWEVAAVAISLARGSAWSSTAARGRGRSPGGSQMGPTSS